MNIVKKITDELLFTKISYYGNSFLGIFKIILSLLSQSLLIFIYAFYNLGMAIAKRTALQKNKKDKYYNYFLTGIIIIISSVFYILYSIYIMYNGSNAQYPMYVAIGIALMTFVDISFAICGIVSAKKKRNINTESIKLINLASSLISLSLTQTAILSFKVIGDISLYCALGGIIFGTLASLVGLYMVIYINHISNLK